MTALATAGDIAGLALLGLAIIVAAARRLLSRVSSPGRQPDLVENRVPGPRALELEEAIGASDQ